MLTTKGSEQKNANTHSDAKLEAFWETSRTTWIDEYTAFMRKNEWVLSAVIKNETFKKGEYKEKIDKGTLNLSEALDLYAMVEVAKAERVSGHRAATGYFNANTVKELLSSENNSISERAQRSAQVFKRDMLYTTMGMYEAQSYVKEFNGQLYTKLFGMHERLVVSDNVDVNQFSESEKLFNMRYYDWNLLSIWLNMASVDHPGMEGNSLKPPIVDLVDVRGEEGFVGSASEISKEVDRAFDSLPIGVDPKHARPAFGKDLNRVLLNPESFMEDIEEKHGLAVLEGETPVLVYVQGNTMDLHAYAIKVTGKDKVSTRDLYSEKEPVLKALGLPEDSPVGALFSPREELDQLIKAGTAVGRLVPVRVGKNGCILAIVTATLPLQGFGYADLDVVYLDLKSAAGRRISITDLSDNPLADLKKLL